MTKPKIALIHYFPIEYYPPLTNLVNCLQDSVSCQARLYTCHNINNRKVYQKDDLVIKRFSFPQKNDSSFIRLWKYLIFHIGTFLSLIFWRPQKVLYYEPNSALPVYWYKKYINRQAEILCHNHEYHDEQEFNRPGMRLAKLCHSKETSFLYEKCSWISQTNRERLQLFKNDNPQIKDDILNSLPNYPPKNWSSIGREKVKKTNQKVRFVYIGSVSLEDTYIKEFCLYLKRNPHLGELDIYTYKVPTLTDDFLKSVSTDNIRYHKQGIEYDQIPSTLLNYDIGLILYKGNTLNYIHNAPNKLFEYLACGLSVWFPKEMIGIYPYESNESLPFITRINFQNLDKFNSDFALPCNQTSTPSHFYHCEDALTDLFSKLKS